MSVTVVTVRETLTGAGMGNWTPAFPLMEADDVVVYLIDTSVSPNTATLLVKDADYTITLTTPADLPSFFQITLINAVTFPGLVLGASRELRISRITSLTQDRTFSQGDAFPEDAVELALDKVVLGAQDSADQYKRAMRANDSDSDAIDLELPEASARAGKFLAFDTTGNVISVTGTLTGVTATSFWTTIVENETTEEGSLEALGLLFDTTANIIVATGQFTGALAVSTDDFTVYQWDGSAYVRTHHRVNSGTLGTRPAAGTFGIGTFYATDTHRLSYSDGSAWVDVSIQESTNSALPATPAAKEIYIDTDRKQLLLGDGATAGGQIIRAAERGYINGLGLTWQTVTTMQVEAGAARNSTDVVTGRRTSALSKAVSAGAWAAGAGGSMVEGTVSSSTWYHVFLLIQPNGTTDWGIDTSTTAANLKAGGASLYTFHRRIGSVYINASSQIERFVQNGNEFRWYDRAAVDHDGPGEANTTGVNRVMLVPPDYKVMAHLNVYTSDGGAHEMRFYDPDTADRTIDVTGLASVPNHAASGTPHGTQQSIMTNTAREIRYAGTFAGGTVGELIIGCYGWTDNLNENWS